MTKPDQHYFTDSIYQLELNLYNIRRELIVMIEEFEKQDCFICLQLKCRCFVKSPEKNSTLTGHNTSKNKDKDTLDEAPSVVSLTKPKFEEVQSLTYKEGNHDIAAWFEASRSESKARTDRLLPTEVLLALKKSWTDCKKDVTKSILDDFKKERVHFDTRYAANAVEVFFNSFKVPQAVTANMAYVSNVAAIYGNHKSRGSEYTYF